MTGRAHGEGETPGAHEDFERFFDSKAVFLPAVDSAIDLADGNTDGGRCHNPFPKPSRRSRATAAAWRLSGLRSRHRRCSSPGALCAFSLWAPALTVSARLLRTSGGMPAKNFVSKRKLRIARIDSGVSTAAAMAPINA